MKNIINKQYCADCEMPINECICEEDSCQFCDNISDLLEQINESDSYDDDFAILHDAFKSCQAQCYKQGYIDALRNNAEIMNELADDMEDDDECDCDECRKERGED